jgi:hypothetical protein
MMGLMLLLELFFFLVLLLGCTSALMYYIWVFLELMNLLQARIMLCAIYSTPSLFSSSSPS